ncbi:hypothetical protein E2C01_038443 [Portunus trituberculatus]|uniref:Uncharacterized protein n=1 Tax=Portunus trituberculatus TaxID=210409 RepID=A0A5B7FI03_PORTR|nr:hypothetical protein [Portunus trituberculatus]
MIIGQQVPPLPARSRQHMGGPAREGRRGSESGAEVVRNVLITVARLLTVMERQVGSRSGGGGGGGGGGNEIMVDNFG